MPTRLFQDDKGNESTMRVVFITFMLITVLLLAVILALQIRQHLETGQSLEEFFKWLTGGGMAAMLAKVWQKRYENKPTPELKPELKPQISQKTHEIKINRIFESERCTLGSGTLFENGLPVFGFKTVELPWRNNERGISRIPAGIFEATAITTFTKKKYAIWITEVVGRSEILIEVANYASELRGCIGAGMRHKGEAVEDSQKAMDLIKGFVRLGEKIKVTISDNF